MTNAIKYGTKIEIRGWDMNLKEVWYPATIGRSKKADRDQLPAGYHAIKFPDGGRGWSHETSFRVAASNSAPN